MPEPVLNPEKPQESASAAPSLTTSRPAPFRLAALQCLGNASRPERRAKLEELIRLAAGKGAQVVLLPELIFHDYFCITEDAAHFDLAHDLEAEPMRAMAALAAELDIVLVVPYYERRAAGLYYNSAAVYDADGSLAGTYRKMHIPDDPGFMEKYYFAPGDLGFRCIQTRYAKLGVLICWDQWYPEAARLTAMQGCDVLLYPTAIGWDDEESAKDANAQALEARHLDAWVTVQRSHAVANGVYVAAANRTGREGHLRFWGNSFIAGPGGEILDRIGPDGIGFVMVEMDPRRIEAERRNWPFFRDRRIDAYGGLQKRFGD